MTVQLFFLMNHENSNRLISGLDPVFPSNVNAAWCLSMQKQLKVKHLEIIYLLGLRYEVLLFRPVGIFRKPGLVVH